MQSTKTISVSWADESNKKLVLSENYLKMSTAIAVPTLFSLVSLRFECDDVITSDSFYPQNIFFFISSAFV